MACILAFNEYKSSMSMLASTHEPIKLSNGAEKLIASSDCFVFDCDGVIWRGTELIDGVPAVLEKLRALGKKIFFVTNNSTKSRKGFLSKFLSLGLTVSPEEIFSSSFAAAAYFEQNPLPPGKKAYIIGMEGIGQELDIHGIPWIGGVDHAGKVLKVGAEYEIQHDRDVAAVIVGYDVDISYYKIQYAQLCINENPGCKFIATNLDAVTHLTPGQEWAGGGAMVGAVRGAVAKEPIVVGKPSPLMVDYIANKYGFDRSRMVMVGDRLDTDVLFGRDNGMKTILTLSGVTTEKKLLSEENQIRPDYYVNSIKDFFI